MSARLYRTLLVLADGTRAHLDHGGDSAELARDHGRHVANMEGAQWVSTKRLTGGDTATLGIIVRAVS
jgi:hypothetical protein